MKQHQYIMQQQVVLHENTSETLQELMKQHQYIMEQQVALHENTSAALTNITQQLDVLTAALVPPSTSPIPTPPPGQCETDLPLTAPAPRLHVYVAAWTAQTFERAFGTRAPDFQVDL